MRKKLACTFCSKTRNKVSFLIEGPEIQNIKQYVCNECVTLMYGLIQPPKESVLEAQTTFTPVAIKTFLDRFVVDQEVAKQALSVALYNHYKRVKCTIKDDVQLEKTNVFLIGPSGSGKTLLIKTIAKMFALPCVITDATTLTEAGYVGNDVESLIELLYKNANGDLEKAQQGIIFIDEIDKISKKTSGHSSNKDVSGEGVQQALLKMVEGTTVTIQGLNKHDAPVEFNTEHVLFICGGAFVGLVDIIKHSLNDHQMGFSTKARASSTNSTLKQVTPDDLIKFGLIPEFVGRFPVSVVLEELNPTALVKILTEPKNNLISQYKKLFKIDGIDLLFDHKYITLIANDAYKQKTGARGLRTILESKLHNTQYMLPDLAKKGLKRVEVDANGEVQHIYNKTKRDHNEEK